LRLSNALVGDDADELLPMVTEIPVGALLRLVGPAELSVRSTAGWTSGPLG
jgi:hypothetical protein